MTSAQQGNCTSGIPEGSGPPDQRSAVVLAVALRKHLLLHQQMGLNSYPLSQELEHFIQPRRRPVAARPQPAPTVVAIPSEKAPARQSLPAALPDTERQEDIRRDLAGCTDCGLSAARSSQVLGQGDIGAGLLIVGDYPRVETETDAASLFGGEEDALLWKMMQAIGLGPKDVYVTNAVKCRPTGGQAPSIENEQACQAYLQREIALVRPRIILAMGVAATRALLGTDASVFRLRGRLHPSRFVRRSGAPIPVMVSFHPRLLLDQPAMKKAAWQDLQIVQRQLKAAMGAAR
jgi:DNA polymerase